VRSVYVRYDNRVSMRRVAPGTYHAYFALGLDWDDEEGSFQCDQDYKEFGSPLRLREMSDGTGIEYSDLEMTLHPVISGNVAALSISKALFHSTLPRNRRAHTEY
jgi:hypothetical protein